MNFKYIGEDGKQGLKNGMVYFGCIETRWSAIGVTAVSLNVLDAPITIWYDTLEDLAKDWTDEI